MHSLNFKNRRYLIKILLFYFCNTPISFRYSSYGNSLDKLPGWFKSITRLAIVLINSKSYEVKIIDPLNEANPSLTCNTF